MTVTEIGIDDAYYWANVYDGDSTYFTKGPVNSPTLARYELSQWLSDWINENLDNFSDSEESDIREALADILSGVQNPEWNSSLTEDVVFITRAMGMVFEVYEVERKRA